MQIDIFKVDKDFFLEILDSKVTLNDFLTFLKTNDLLKQKIYFKANENDIIKQEIIEGLGFNFESIEYDNEKNCFFEIYSYILKEEIIIKDEVLTDILKKLGI
ncbi:MAG: hypothetical protein JXM74_03075 [Fusobacteriaceae bacterium]|nr:hypothetical protein [Fusobacteriaceae bacterium]MBN2837714.1 hypothetical protein [Fusobacteriaceae bacterium]